MSEKQLQSVKPQSSSLRPHQPLLNSQWLNISRESQRASHREKSMGFREAFRRFPMACFWSIVISTTLVMEGYDVSLLPSFYGYPQFQKKFGQPFGDDNYQLTPAWQTGLSNGANVGEIIGIFINGYASHRWGQRRVLVAAMVAVSVFIFLQFFAPSVEVLLVGEILCGIPWGIFQTSAPIYVSEICPLAIRGYLTMYINLAWSLGALILSFVVRACLTLDNKWGYRIPFAVQWTWPALLIVPLYCAPESPWFLVRKGRLKEAEKSLARLELNASADEVKNTVSMMQHTDAIERAVTSGTTYWDCFRGSELRRTEIACMTWAGHTLCGGQFQGWVVYLFQTAGISATQAYNVSLAQCPLGVAGTIFSWSLAPWLGRRTLYVGGLFLLFTVLLITGLVALAPDSNVAAQYTAGSFLMVFTFLFNLTAGPIGYPIITEVSSTRLRQKTLALARIAYIIVTIVAAVVNPYLLNPTAANLKGKAALVWAAVCLPTLIWAFFRIPETKYRTFEEIDLMFHRNVPARKFKSYHINPYEDLPNKHIK
ncbi:general alpha-glucoside permease [Trichomonascus vanleenenianus]|uniref:general alpha-glucoside permease n=1 Tax=Trichomonascus vanleenenianus TaxID=2268995 RepID=UPI003ECB1CE8